jgi:hypothetical protein
VRATAVLLVVALAAASARAEHCPAPAGADPALAEIDAQVRLSYIQSQLRRTAHRANIWRWSWGVGIVAATAGNLIAIPLVDRKGARIDFYVGAATTVVGLVPLLGMPLKVLHDHEALDERVARGGPICDVLADAERRFRRDAANESDGRALWLHVANVVLNGAVGLYLGLAYHHWTSGIINAVGGSVVGEAIIYTQPIGDVGALRRYRKGDLGPRPTGVGLGLTFRF